MTTRVAAIWCILASRDRMIPLCYFQAPCEDFADARTYCAYFTGPGLLTLQKVLNLLITPVPKLLGVVITALRLCPRRINEIFTNRVQSSPRYNYQGQLAIIHVKNGRY